MRSAIVALLIAIFLAAQSAPLKVDADGFRPFAIVTLVGGALGENTDGDDDDRKLHGARVSLAIAYPDLSMAAVSVQGQSQVQEFHIVKSPLYQLNAVWRI